MDILKRGGDTLDAVVAAVTIVEDDPMTTPWLRRTAQRRRGSRAGRQRYARATHRAGSVASVRRIKNVSRLAKTVMEKTTT